MALPAGLALALALGGAGSARGAEGRVVHRIQLDSIVHPVAAEFLAEELDAADAAGAAALVVELDTPGGLLESTRAMSEAMLAAKTPVVVWVAPEGARAASAGFFLLLSADFAAMAPSTNTGAAHPVGGAGETIEGVLGEKVEQDAAATIRALATRRGRNVERAEAAVKESHSFTADEALEAGLIDLVAPDLPSLLSGLDGREFEKPAGTTRTLEVAGAVVVDRPMHAFRKLLSILIHPNIAYLLMTIGFLGLYFELSHPGAILPGVVGGISLLLGLYALSVLPVDFAGIGLILLAIALFIAEVKVTSYGLLTVGGVVALVLGSLMLFDSPEPALQVSLGLVISVSIAFAAVAVLLASLALRAQSRRPTTGAEGLVGARARTVSALAPHGKVFVQGEWWNAVAESEVPAGAEVEIVSVDGMTLHVRAGGAG
ncbi:MAG: nodulation protein NfeD [Acidobacteria bacterium]|nr:nodulation protein NfeD [Acidobacteriota bacterium]